MAIKIEPRYTINGRAEEFDCSRCGWPMYTGDRAVMTSDNEVFCGSGCANKHIKEESERIVKAEVRPVYTSSGDSFPMPLVSRYEVWGQDSNGRSYFVGASSDKATAESEAAVINRGNG
jgi:hypothetical protein